MSLRISMVALGLLASAASTTFAGENLLMDAYGVRDPSNIAGQHAPFDRAPATAGQHKDVNVSRSSASSTATSGAGASPSELGQRSTARRVVPSTPLYDDIYRGGAN